MQMNEHATQIVLLTLHLDYIYLFFVNFGAYLQIMRTFSPNVIIMSVKKGYEVLPTLAPLRFVNQRNPKNA